MRRTIISAWSDSFSEVQNGVVVSSGESMMICNDLCFEEEIQRFHEKSLRLEMEKQTARRKIQVCNKIFLRS